MTDATLTLAAEFAPASEADWRKLVDGVLKGQPFERLVGKTVDGLPIQPLYPRAADAAPIAGRASGISSASPWQILQRVDHPDPKQANAQALHDLENGATGLVLTIAGGKGARGFGLPPTKTALDAALEGVHLDAGIGIELDLAPGQREAALHVVSLIETRGLDPASVHLRTSFDPIGSSAYSGVAVPWSETTAPLFGAALGDLAARGFTGPLAVADGRVIHDAGGSEAQELAFVLACAVQYLRALEAGGIALADARDMIFARLSADADQFLTVAKFRALRLLWARIEQSCGLVPKPLFISAETSWRMLTQRDAAVNMLRATIAVFAAGIGGADAITVLPHTLALGLPDAFARRVARNTQLVLLEESNLAKVADPAAGSGGIEALTQALCNAAWTQFQAIERAGGAFAALQQGAIQRDVLEVRHARAKAVAQRKTVMTGASEFPNLHETMPVVLTKREDTPPAAHGNINLVPLEAMRLAAPFEALRDRSDAILAKAGARPKVLLVTLGTPADFTARATLAKSFFETGGIEAVETSPDAFPQSSAALVCLCSSDKVYAEQAASAAKALHEAGAKHIYLAGKPGDLESALRDAGVTDFIAAGGNALETLTAAYAKLDTP